MSKQTDNFINKVKGGATQLWSIYKVLPSVAIAQAALESAWGTSGLATKYNNLFGIKGSYGGNAANMATWEVYGGVRYDIKANFRAYPNWETSIKDYGVFLNVNSRYKKALGLKNYKDQIKAIHVAGYATDPQYQSKIISIIEANNLVQFDKQVLGGAAAVPSKPISKPVATKPQPTGNSVVKSIQKTVGVKEDGWDGPNTRKGVVKLFQRYFGANPDGYVGNETLNKSKVIRSGDKGWHVYAVQALLYLKGYTSVGTPDQKFGPASVQATKNFQKDNGLGVDGTPGKQTYAKLLKL